MIRVATIKDADAIVQMGFREYIEERAYKAGMNFNYKDCKSIISFVLSDPMAGLGMIAEIGGNPVGFIIGQYTFGMSIDPNCRVCHELGWYVLPEARGLGFGLALLDTFTWILDSMKPVSLIEIGRAVMGPDTDFLLDKYKKRGFVPFQTMFFREVKK